jgi:1-deoxy-D-xylulose-5-phosphate reductoisomerase
MKVPIFNTLYFNSKKNLKSDKLKIDLLNNLKFNKVDSNRYPMIKILNLLSNKHSLYDTIIVSANDALVDLYLKKKIKFTDIYKNLFELIKTNHFLKYKKIYPYKLKEILDLNNYVRLKINEKVYKS